MLKEIVVRQVQPGSDKWLKISTRRRPEVTIRDREYMTKHAAETIAEWQREL
jgi:hypothetical protein